MQRYRSTPTRPNIPLQITITLALGLGVPLHAWAQSTPYYRIIGSADPFAHEAINGVAATADNGFIVCGQAQNTSEYDPVLMKFDEEGNVEWQHVFGEEGREELYEVITMSDGGYAAIGTTFSFTTPLLPQMLVVRRDANGDPVWTKTFRTFNMERGSALVEADANGLLLVGTIELTTDLYIVRTDSAGNVLWNRRYATFWGDHPSAVTRDSDGGYVICGRMTSGSDVVAAFAMKIDSLGGLLWWRGYQPPDPPGDEITFSAIEALTNGYFVYGSLRDDVIGRSVLVRLDTVGAPQWAKSYATTTSYFAGGSDMAFIDAGDPSAGLVMTGSMGPHTELHTMATGLDGTVLWSTVHGNSISTFEFGHALCVNTDGNFTVGGMVEDSLVPGPGNMFLVRTDAQGENGGCEERPEIMTSQLLLDDTLFMVVPTSPNVVVNDRIFFDQPDLIPTLGCSVAAVPAVPWEEFSLVLVPNPMSANTELRLHGADGRKAALSFVDPLGRELGAQHWQGPAYQGQTTTWQLKRGGLSAGLYIVHITFDDGRILAERLIIE